MDKKNVVDGLNKALSLEWAGAIQRSPHGRTGSGS
jgi:hypothetical protein